MTTIQLLERTFIDIFDNGEVTIIREYPAWQPNTQIHLTRDETRALHKALETVVRGSHETP